MRPQNNGYHVVQGNSTKKPTVSSANHNFSLEISRNTGMRCVPDRMKTLCPVPLGDAIRIEAGALVCQVSRKTRSKSTPPPNQSQEPSSGRGRRGALPSHGRSGDDSNGAHAAAHEAPGMHTSALDPELTSFLLVRYVKYAVVRSLLRLVIILALARPAGDLGSSGDASGNTSERYSFTTRDSYTFDSPERRGGTVTQQL